MTILLEIFADIYASFGIPPLYFAYINATISLVIGVIIAISIRISFRYVFQRTGFDRLLKKLIGDKAKIGDDSIGVVLGKILTWTVFLWFLRLAVQQAGFDDVEMFLNKVVIYLPQLFLAVLIAFFGIRIGNFVFTVVYQTTRFQSRQTGKVLGNLARTVILFFTFTIVLDYTQIVDEFMIRTIFVGFTFALALASGLAFGLGGRDFACEVIAMFRNSTDSSSSEDQ